jgi:hypothetical protein
MVIKIKIIQNITSQTKVLRNLKKEKKMAKYYNKWLY